MGFDKNINQDHCYLEDGDHVAMNVEIIEDNGGLPQNLNKCTDSFPETTMSDEITVNKTYEDNSNCGMKVLSYAPYPEYCQEQHGMFLHIDDKLVKVGDKFGTLEEFVQYLNDHAKQWCFYYRCLDSRKPSTCNESYTYSCVFLRNKEKYKKRGLRKRIIGTKTNCPCKIKLRHIGNEKELTVVFVCNHHDHELSQEEFQKLQHGRRLPPHVKEEVMDLLTLGLDFRKISAYVEMETGLAMNRAFFYGLERTMKIKNVKRYLSEERLKMLLEKINSIQYDDENTEEQTDQLELCNNNETDTPKTSKLRRFKSGLRNARITPHAKRRTNLMDDSTDPSKRYKIEENQQILYSNETQQSVEHLQELIKCETQTNPWVSDQCVPVLPNRTPEDETDNAIQVKSDTDSQDGANVKYTIEYYDPDSKTHVLEIINSELSDVIGDDIDNVNNGSCIAYETVVTDAKGETIINRDKDNQPIQHDQGSDASEDVINNSEGNDYCFKNKSAMNHDADDANNPDEIENYDENNTEAVQYVTEGDDNVVQYVTENDASAHDVGVQANVDSPNSLVPVFDVYMKDGNVTGFVINDNNVSGVRDSGVDKEVQTNGEQRNNDDPSQLDSIDEPCDTEIIYEKSDGSPDTITKHEYVHRNNVHKYMVQRNFPKYIKMLAQETNADVMRMLRNVYREKGMFKMTTTHRGREGNTRIWYIAERPRFRRSGSVNDVEVTLLKEKIKELEKENSDLMDRNKQLHDIALKLLNG